MARGAGVSLIAARLEDGYDTVVSECGASLSGGEKQCIGIARAMLKDAPIVILDEPTSAMDAHTEQLVMGSVERLLRGRTGFNIAHRLSTVMAADAVFVLDDGRIVESGDPAALLSDSSTRFAGLARAQLIPEDSGASVSELRGERRIKAADRSPLRALSARWQNRRMGAEGRGTR
jgi:ABC-type multidrug transport system fused ATPase/permease subunit